MKEYTYIYFIGIGGIGMSAIARYCKAKGFIVSGYDKTPSPLTLALESEGIGVHYEDNISFIPKDAAATLVIYTPAVPSDLKELCFVMENGYKVIKRSRMLGEITAGQKCLAVAGTHGKTTTSTLTSHLFTAAGDGCSAFLGGISKNYDSNLLIAGNDIIVAEADEFDRSFLQLYPDTAVITSMDADHLDIYGDKAHLTEAFKAFASQVSGTLIAKYGLDITEDDTKAELKTYSFNDSNADFYASDITEDGHFDLHHPGGVIRDCIVGVPGWVNIENAVAASAIALVKGLDGERIKAALASFSGVKRRFDLQVRKNGCVYIDDYAHHPQEIAAALSSIREAFPTMKMTAVFQPHLYTRTRDFAADFASALSKVDKLILLEIYPAREEPIPGITSEIIFKDVDCGEKVLLKRNEFMDYISKEPVELLVTIGAGDIDRFVEPIRQMLEARN